MGFVNYLIGLRLFPTIRKWNLLRFILTVFDSFAIGLAFQLSYFINYPQAGGYFFTEKKFLYFYLGILPFWLIILYLINIHEIPRTKRYRAMLLQYFQSLVIMAAALLITYFLFKMVWISRLFMIEFVLLGFLFLFFTRLLEYQLSKEYRSRGYNYLNIVLIADESSLRFVEKIISHKEWGYRIIAIFSESDRIKEKYQESIVLLPEYYLKVINDLMEVDIVDEVLYLKSKIIPAEVRQILRSCEELGVVFGLINKDKAINLTNAIHTNVADEKFLTFINIPHKSHALALKNITDIYLSVLMLIGLSPVMIGIALLIKLTSPGPIFFKQKRVGLRGRQFDLYKFRTMIVNADELKKDLLSKNEVDGPVFKIRNDPRITSVGALLRKTGLDELPQLFNILRGEMSLIGPRPPLEEETKHYKRWQLRRLSVKPGLSCFWQIKTDRNKIKFEKWMEMDLAYIDNWSPRLDFLILLKTVKTVFKRSGL